MSVMATKTPSSTQLPGTYTCRRCGIRRHHNGSRPRTLCRDCDYYASREAA